MAMDLQALTELRDKMAEVERQELEEMTAKCQLLGFVLVKLDMQAPEAPKIKRKRRSKAEIEADNG